MNTALNTRTDPTRQVAIVEASGSLLDHADTDQLQLTCASSPAHYGLVVVLSGVTQVSDHTLDILKTIAHDARARGQAVAFACADELLRAELILGDLDTVAPVLDSLDSASPIVEAA